MAKKKSRRGLKIIIGLVALLVIAAGTYFVLMLSQTSGMTPLDTQEVSPGIFAVRDGFVNFYLYKVDDKYIAVDAGTSVSNAKDELNRLGISSDDVIAVLLTHTHGDHTGALSVFDKAVVYAGANARSGKVSKTLADGEITEIAGASVECIFTPGHADDSVCYLIDGKVLFAGDTLSLRDNQVGLFNSFFNKSDDVQKADIERLAALSGVQIVFSAHYGFTDHAVFP